MPHFLCAVCGTQYAERAAPPERCAICADERQYEARRSPQWLTHADLVATHKNTVRQIGPDLLGLGVEPAFAIGQRAILVLRPEGNVLWDCLPLLDPGLVRLIEGVGGIATIAISHPHYYSAMAEWSAAFDAPVVLHEADREWVMRDGPHVRFWSGDRLALAGGLTLVRGGGHFDGATMLHVAGDGGTLLSGDVIQVVPDRRFVSFMYSYPNLLPLSAAEVDGVVASVADLGIERIHGAFWGLDVLTDGKARVLASAERYKRALAGEHQTA